MTRENSVPYTTCKRTGKRGYESRKDARRARGQHVKAEGLSAYRCRYCYSWHLGHLPPEVKRGTLPRPRSAGHRVEPLDRLVGEPLSLDESPTTTEGITP